MHPTHNNTRELGNGEQLRPTDYIWLEGENDDEPDEFIPLGHEWDGHILDGSEDYAFVRIVQESALESLCREYGIDTPLGIAILKIELTATKDINHLIKRSQL
jgi:hypothetical protein